MPLAWAHAEFVKLMISRQLGYPFDRPAAVWRRYGGRRSEAKRAIWYLHAPIGRIKNGIALIIRDGAFGPRAVLIPDALRRLRPPSLDVPVLV
jgi:glucoamylase